jgi:hypothetical protein
VYDRRGPEGGIHFSCATARTWDHRCRCTHGCGLVRIAVLAVLAVLASQAGNNPRKEQVAISHHVASLVPGCGLVPVTPLPLIVHATASTRTDPFRNARRTWTGFSLSRGCVCFVVN